MKKSQSPKSNTDPLKGKSWEQIDEIRKERLASDAPLAKYSPAPFEVAMIALVMASRNRRKFPPQHYFQDAYDLLWQAGGFSCDAQLRSWADEYDARHADDHPVGTREAMKRLGYTKNESFWAAVERTMGEDVARRCKKDPSFWPVEIEAIERHRSLGKAARAASARMKKALKKSPPPA